MVEAREAIETPYGFPAPLWRALERHRPPAMGLLQRWRSPLRGPWLTSVFGSVLLIGLPVVILTGLLSYIAYGPQFGQAIPHDVGWLKLPTFDWPSRPSWLYRLTQGLHVGLGLIIIPVVLAKLWSVIPRLFAWPPLRSIAQLVERLSLLMLVGGILFELATGVLNIQYDYVFGFSFYTAHYFGAWVFIAGFVIHVLIKLPKMVTGLRSLSFRTVLRTSRADTRPEPPDVDGLVAADPAPPTMSRRGALALVGGGALFVAVLTAGQTLGGFTRRAALLLPRGRSRGDGPNDFQVNSTAAAAAITPADIGDGLAAHLPAESVRTATAGPGRSRSDAAAHRRTADRLRRRVVDHPNVERGSPPRPGRPGRDAHPRPSHRALTGARSVDSIMPSCSQPGGQSRCAAGPSGQRRRPVAGSRLSRAHHRARAARCAQHQMGTVHRIRAALICAH